MWGFTRSESTQVFLQLKLKRWSLPCLLSLSAMPHPTLCPSPSSANLRPGEPRPFLGCGHSLLIQAVSSLSTPGTVSPPSGVSRAQRKSRKGELVVASTLHASGNVCLRAVDTMGSTSLRRGLWSFRTSSGPWLQSAVGVKTQHPGFSPYAPAV